SVRKLVNFADVVQERAGEQQVAINLGIVVAEQIARAEERDYVLEQSADEGVVQGLGGGSGLVGGGDFGVGHEGFDQSFEVRVLEAGDKGGESLPELFDVFGGFGKIIGEVGFGFFHPPQLVNGELPAVVVPIEQTF